MPCQGLIEAFYDGRTCFPLAGVVPLPGMNFGKIALGALLLAVGVVLLAVRVGFAHPDTPILLLRYWPVLLIAFGLAFLAGAIKNPMLGCFAVLLILGGTALGIWWLSGKHKRSVVAHGGSTIDLAKAGVSSLVLRVYTFGGSCDLRASGARALTIARQDAAGDSSVGYRFEVSGGKAVLEWPRSSGPLTLSNPGARIKIVAPPALPLSLNWSGRAGSLHADLTRLAPTRCSLHEIFASSRLDIGEERPEEIRVWGVASELRLRVPADCPVRLMSSPFTLRTLPSDFEQYAMGKVGSKDRVDASEGRGRTLRVYANGYLTHVTVERMPVVASPPLKPAAKTPGAKPASAPKATPAPKSTPARKH